MSLSFAAGLFWTSVACCLVAQLLIVRSVFGARHVPAPTADVPRSRGSVELLWAVVPAVALAVLLVFTWRAVEERDALRAAGSSSSGTAVEPAR
jgi:heme/copper-type cytochrome/quinol oxidase subunit 2